MELRDSTTMYVFNVWGDLSSLTRSFVRHQNRGSTSIPQSEVISLHSPLTVIDEHGRRNIGKEESAILTGDKLQNVKDR